MKSMCAPPIIGNGGRFSTKNSLSGASGGVGGCAMTVVAPMPAAIKTAPMYFLLMTILRSLIDGGHEQRVRLVETNGAGEAILAHQQIGFDAAVLHRARYHGE